MRARYPDICARCGGRIAIGTQIAQRDTGYIHIECASGQDDE